MFILSGNSALSSLRAPETLHNDVLLSDIPLVDKIRIWKKVPFKYVFAPVAICFSHSVELYPFFFSITNFSLFYSKLNLTPLRATVGYVRSNECSSFELELDFSLDLIKKYSSQTDMNKASSLHIRDNGFELVAFISACCALI